jgi:nucleoid-associated protein YgaU
MFVTRGTPIGHSRLAPTPSPRTAQDVLRGIVALTALLAALVGVPWALAALGGAPLPAQLPSLPEIGDALTSPDDGSLFLGALLIVGWVGWALFAVSVLVEIPAQLRGRSAPRLPALATSQRVAGALVTTIAILFVTTSASPTPTAAATVVATGTSHHVPNTDAEPSSRVRLSSVADQTTVGSVTQAAHATHPTYRVRRHDTLWAIAERSLGAGERFTDIAALNYGVEQRDGRALTNSHWIYPGWVLRLPPDARLDHHDSHQQAHPDEQYTVQPGDTLSDIAQTELGSAKRYDQIAELNAGRRQPDGHTLSDPDHIEPGWHLQLPSTSPRPGTATDHRTGGSDEHASTRDDNPSPTVTPGRLPGTHDSSAAESNLSARVDDDRSAFDNPIPAKVGLGLAGITAAALLAALARRRTLQQRARRPGYRITMPNDDTRVAETQLRVANDRDTLDMLRAALVLLARRCAEAGRLLPGLAAVRVNRTNIELLLVSHESDLVAPFEAVENDRWRIEFTEIPVPADVLANDDDVPFPYPALLTVGADDDTTLLIDLEVAGTLTVYGPQAETRPILDAWAVELAAAPISENIGVTLIGADWPSAAVDAARVRLAGSAETATRGAAARTRDVKRILTAAHLDTVREARSRGVASDIWDPEVVLCIAPKSNAVHDVSALQRASGQGLALITGVTSNEVAPSGWTLTQTSNRRWRIEPLGITVSPPRLEKSHLAAVTAALAASHDHDGVEAPSTQAAAESIDNASGPHADRQRILPRVSPGEDAAPQVGPPQILVLGPVAVRFTNGAEAESDRRRKLTELAAYIALHPGADNHRIDDAIWPTRRVSRSTRHSATSRLRRWLGPAPDGQPWLPVVPDRGQYRFRPEVRCDWIDFQVLARRGFSDGPDGLDDLSAALALVRGQPFAGVDPAWYAWAEYDTQEMISAVTDVAHALSVALLGTGDARAAREAASKGLLVEPLSETLTRDAVFAATAMGDSEDAARLIQQLRTRLSAIDPDGDLDAEMVAPR